MADNTTQSGYGQCEIKGTLDTKLSIFIDQNYYNTHSAYEKCKCIQKIKSSLEELGKAQMTPKNTLDYIKASSYLEDYKQKYIDNKCDEVFKNNPAENAKDVYSKTTEEDKARIEAENKKQVTQRIIIGVSVFVVAVGMIVFFAKKNNSK
jgi:hypothetical protein